MFISKPIGLAIACFSFALFSFASLALGQAPEPALQPPADERSVLETTPRVVETSVVIPEPAEASVLQESPAADEVSVVQGAIESPQSATSIAVAMLNVHNRMRAEFGRSPQALSAELTKLAQQHAQQMAATGALYHMAPERLVVRENIAMGQENVESVFAIWRSKATQFRNLMGGEQSVGFGYAVGVNGEPYWVAVFGTQVDEAAEVAPASYEAPATPGTAPRDRPGLIPAPLKQIMSGGVLRRIGARLGR